MKKYLPAILLCVVSFCVYLPTLGYDFTWDDHVYVVKNEWLRSWSYLPQYFTNYLTSGSDGINSDKPFRPIRNISYLIDYKIWGLNPFGFHLQNMVWHLLVVLMLYLVLVQLLKNPKAALAGALVFAVHPLLSETVAWVKARDMLLSAFFGLASFYFFLKGQEQKFKTNEIVLCILFYTLAVYSYLITLSFFIIYVFAILVLPGEWMKSNRKQTLVLLGLSLLISFGYLFHRTVVIGQVQQQGYLVEGSFLWTMVSMLPAIAKYLELLVFPIDLNADYLTFAQHTSFLNLPVIFSVILLSGLGVSAVVLWFKKKYYAVFALGWFFIFLLPVANVIPTMQLLAERFAYISVMSIALLVGLSFVWTEKSKSYQKFVYLGTAVLLLFFVGRLETRLPVWANDMTLNHSLVQRNPENARALRNYATALVQNKEYDLALEQLQIYQQKFEPAYKVQYNLVEVYSNKGMLKEALSTAEQGLKIFPENSDIVYINAQANAISGNFETAAGLFEKAISLDPDNTIYQMNRGVMLQNQGNLTAAKQVYLGLVDQLSDNIDLYVNLGRVSYHTKNFNDALMYYQRVLELQADHKEANEMIGYLSVKQNTAL